MATPEKSARVFLGSQRGLWQRQRTCRTRDYLEIDSTDGYDVIRRRIFYDDILLVTVHSARRWLPAIAAGVLALACLALAFALRSEVWLAALALFLCSLGCLLFAVLCLVLTAQTVTVFGKRTRAQMRFWPNAERGREVYLLVCRLARERQAQSASPPQAQPAAAAPAD
jgi:hypothetical protein